MPWVIRGSTWRAPRLEHRSLPTPTATSRSSAPSSATMPASWEQPCWLENTSSTHDQAANARLVQVAAPIGLCQPGVAGAHRACLLYSVQLLLSSFASVRAGRAVTRLREPPVGRSSSLGFSDLFALLGLHMG